MLCRILLGRYRRPHTFCITQRGTFACPPGFAVLLVTCKFGQRLCSKARLDSGVKAFCARPAPVVLLPTIPMLYANGLDHCLVDAMMCMLCHFTPTWTTFGFNAF